MPQHLHEECVTAVREFYQFLDRMFVDEASIVNPPAGGWPNVTSANMHGLNKSESVISLLRHLPYIRADDCGHKPEIAQ